MVKIEVFPHFLKNNGSNFFNFLHEDRSNPFLTHGENCMSGNIQFLRYFGLNQGRGRSRALGDHFSKAKISGTKTTNQNLIGFSDTNKTVLFKCPFSNFEPIHSYHPENRGRKSRSQTGPNLHFRTIFKIFLPFVSQNHSGFLCQVKALQWAHSGKSRLFRKVLFLELWPKT